MEDILKVRLDKTIDTYSKLRKKYRWSTNEIIIRFTAFLYGNDEKEPDIAKLDEVLKYIKKSTGIFSHYRSTLKLTMGALMLLRYEEPEKAFQTLLEYEGKMKEKGFKNSAYLAIAAYSLMEDSDNEDVDERIERAVSIYKRMKKNHYWLTTADDYPVAVLLSGIEEDENLLINNMESIYQELNKAGFRKSNGLQFLSHLLTFNTGNVSEKVARCTKIFDTFKSNRFTVYSTYYGTIGFLAMLGEESSEALQDVLEAVQYLKSCKSFGRSYKNINLLIASALVSSVYIKDEKQHKNLAEAGIGISIQAIIAAQTAALAAVAGASAAASAGTT